MQDRRVQSRVERFLMGAAIAIPASNRAQRRRIRAAAMEAALSLNTFIEKHTALAAALAINTGIVLLLCLYTFRSPRQLAPISFSLGGNSILEGSGTEADSGEESHGYEETPAQPVRYTLPSPPQPAATMAAPVSSPLPAVIETLASSRFFHAGIGGTLAIGGGSGGNGKRIGGLNIQANRLGVILDVSGSMADDSEKVNRIIAEQFSNAICIPVEGCGLQLPRMVQPETELPFNFGQAAQTGWSTESAWPEPKSKSPKKEWPWTKKEALPVAHVVEGDASPTIQALTILADRGVDAIYWFCDLQDLQSDDALLELDRILRTGRIRLYLQSLEVEPRQMLREIVVRSGGAYSVEF